MALTSENLLDLRKKATNFSDWRETRRRRTNLAKIMIHETTEKKSKIPRTTLAAGPVSRKKARRESCPPGRFSARRVCQPANIIQMQRNIGIGERQREWARERDALSLLVR